MISGCHSYLPVSRHEFNQNAPADAGAHFAQWLDRVAEKRVMFNGDRTFLWSGWTAESVFCLDDDARHRWKSRLSVQKRRRN